jgi:predicted nucleic acid-binding protein
MLLVDTKGVLIEPTVTVTELRDKKDNFLVELAETATADYLLTRDKDVLVMEKWKTTAILKPEDFLPLIREAGLLDK